MPSLMSFGDLQFDDHEAIDAWLLAHAVRHSTYRKAASLLGIAIADGPFTSEPDDDWFGRHMSAHQALQILAAPDNSVDLTALSANTWASAQEFYDWHRMHNLIHLRLDEALGIFS